MALRDTSWITDTHAIRISKKVVGEKVYFFPLGPLERTRNVIVDEWICLTQAAAENYADTHAADTNTTFSVNQTDMVLDAYKLTRTVDSKGSWSRA
jgi:hypothetical protein